MNRLFPKCPLPPCLSKGVPILFIALFCLCACAHVEGPPGPPIQKGTPVRVDYTCRIQDGPLVTTTLEDVAPKAEGDPEDSRLFLPRRTYEPEELVAGVSPEDPFDDNQRQMPSLQLKGLHTVIREQLARAVVGKPAGAPFSVEVTAEYQDEVPEPERQITLRRAANYPKTQRLAREDFMARTGAGRPPEVGMKLSLVQGMDSRVASVTEDEIVVAIEPRQEAIQTPFGRKVVIDQGDRWVTRIQMEEGDLVRTGPQLGRIAEIRKGMFLVDYGHPFGGKVLECEVIAEPIPSAPTITASEETSQDAVPAQAPPGAPEPVQPPLNESPAAQASSSAETSESVPPLTAKAGGEVKKSVSGVVEKGDLVEIDYTAAFADGALLHTTLPEVADDPDRAKVDGFQRPPQLGPEVIAAGEPAVLPGLSQLVIGMKPSETRRVVLPPQQAFGAKAPSLVKEYDAVKVYPMRTSLTPKQWHQQVEGFPVEGETYSINPYLLARVRGISASGVSVQLSAKEATVEDELGTTTITEKEETIEVTLRPKMGIPYEVEGKQGRVVAADGRTFSVDFNHPFAGRPLELDVEVVSLTKAADLAEKELAWIEDHDEGLAAAADRGKPVFLVLYADWCGYSERLLDETLKDPRIRLLSEDFVWVKVDSHQQEDLNAFYEQEGYPLMVVLSPEGEIAKRIEGFKDAAFLFKELKGFADAGTVSVKRPGTAG